MTEVQRIGVVAFDISHIFLVVRPHSFSSGVDLIHVGYADSTPLLFDPFKALLPRGDHRQCILHIESNLPGGGSHEPIIDTPVVLERQPDVRGGYSVVQQIRG